MRIVSVASAFPPNIYSQESITGALHQFWDHALKNPAVLDRLHANCGVKKRHLVCRLEEYQTLQGFGQANDIWIRAAQELGEKAICRAVRSAHVAPSSLDAIFFASVTGVASPSIDARLVNRMSLSPRIKRTPIFGLGCVAGAAGIARAADYLRAFPDQTAVLLSVELCSLNWQKDDLSTANLISAGLFGDGAAAVIIAGENSPLPGVEIIGTRSTFYPDTEDAMGWDISEKGFRIVLSPGVPQIIREQLRGDMDEFLADHGLSREDIGSWIIHTGGPKVLRAVESALELQPEALEASWESLAQVGNLSSASVLLVLEDHLKHRRREPGTYSVLAAMGPGFCSEIVLLRW
jgi:alkylresorcinol/alkylpyrone synthase